MSRHAYSGSAMIGDYLRAAAGLAAMSAILIAVPVGAIGGTLFGGFAALFSMFGARTALRHRTQVELLADGLQASGLQHVLIPWEALDRMRLAYYSTRRDRREGWMQLELRAGRAKLRLDSRIDGFAELATAAAAAAAARGIELDPATAANLEALGIRQPPILDTARHGAEGLA